MKELEAELVRERTAKGALQAELVEARKENLQAREGRPALQAEIEEIARRAVTAELVEAQKENLQLRTANQAAAAELVEARKNNLHLSSWVANQATITGQLEAMQKERSAHARAVRWRKREEERKRSGGQKTPSEPEPSESVPESESVPWDS